MNIKEILLKIKYIGIRVILFAIALILLGLVSVYKIPQIQTIMCNHTSTHALCIEKSGIDYSTHVKKALGGK